MEFKINPQARFDIQKQIHYYNNQKKGLGKDFHSDVKIAFETIRKNPFYQIRYENIRCLPLKKFPAMIHYSLDELKNQVIVHSVFHTSQNPNLWQKRL